MNASKYVDKSELLYRFFRSNKENPNEDHYDKDESDNILIDRAAFSSGNPSVDRAKLTRCPKDTKVRSSDGVMGIWAKDVKDLKLPDYPDYTVNVKKTPEKDNKAHAEIVLLSEKGKIISGKDQMGRDKLDRRLSRQFRKLLAEISVCLIEPNPK